MLRSLAVALSLTITVPVVAAQPEGPQRHLTGADLFGLEWASDPQISPDGRSIAYVRKSNDVMTDRAKSAIWLIDVASGQQTPLVTGAGSSRWSPDSKRLAYIGSPDGTAPQLYVRWMASGVSAKVTGLPDSPGAIAWSPDGNRIAYLVRVPGEGATLGKAPPKPEGAQWAPPLQVITDVTYRSDEEGYVQPGKSHIFIVSSDGGAPRQLSYGAYDDGGPLSWTPDGRSIVFSANRHEDWERNPNNSEVYALDVATGGITALTSRAGPDANPVVSPDGTRIAWLGFDDQFLGYQNAEIYVANRDGSGRRSLTASLDRSIDDVVWAGNGALLAKYDDHAGNKIVRIDLSGRMTTAVAALVPGGGIDRPYSGGSFSSTPSGSVAYTCGNEYRPADICVGNGRRLTRLNEDLLASKVLGKVSKLAVTAPDGRPIDAWLVLPPDADPAKRYPTFLEIHGGPFTAYGPFFSTDDQLYAAAGYAVLYANPRGSTSYGAEFANLIHHKYPGDDYGDLMAAVDAAIAGGHADGDNLFVTGGSGGGVLTAWTVGKTDRFKAAATQKPVIDWASFALTADNPAFFAKYWFGKMPWEDPQGYWARSPLSLVGNVKTPTLVIVGSEDYRTPVSEAEQYYAALQLRGVPTALVKVPGAGHGTIAARPSQSAAKAAAILAWFDRYRTK
ncbi:Peptidase S9 prolyl oligopeptidase catalytic domain-containing protein [Sphingomonas antarctica]|uniref:prolyl oligopeptidase family serine peptidase n=1 Tax=Sphingomonas antarctica TaxID=2040274 RepID=UPI0039EB179A